MPRVYSTCLCHQNLVVVGVREAGMKLIAHGQGLFTAQLKLEAQMSDDYD